MYKLAIIDDSADNRDFFYYLLRDEYFVLTYESGEEALKRIPQDLPDLIIMDIRLRGIDGVEVLKHIRQDGRLASVPAMAVTANAMAGDREKYLAAGFDEYVSKPIREIRDFIAAIRRLLARS
jgi:CheY-like chemotaxis protein